MDNTRNGSKTVRDTVRSQSGTGIQSAAVASRGDTVRHGSGASEGGSATDAGTKGPRELTKRLLAGLRVGDRLRDTRVRGLFAERTPRGVSLKVQADLWRDGRCIKTCRVTLGRFGDGSDGTLTLDAARAKAMAVLAEIKAGVDPNAKAATAAATAAGAGALTCERAFTRYARHLRERAKPAAPRTIREFEYLCRRYLAPLDSVALADVTPSMLEAEHARIAREFGPVVANKALRAFRSAYNLARDRADDPSALQDRICRAIEWREESRRKVDLGPEQLPAWIAKVRSLSNPLRAVLHEFGLFSGLRPGNLMGLRRGWLNLEARTITIPRGEMKARDPARGDFAVPLSDHMVGLLRRALAAGDLMTPNTPWVFPSLVGGGRKPIAVIREPALGRDCGHATRHVYRTQAVAAGVDPTTIEILLDHAVGGGGVAASYLHARGLGAHLQACQDRITAHLLGLLK